MVGNEGPSASQLPGKNYRELVGRDNLINESMKALQDPKGKWLVAVDGMGGIGKTALAREVAERCEATRLFDVVVWEQAFKKGFVGIEKQEQSDLLTFEKVLDAIARRLGAVDVLKLNRKQKIARVQALLRSRPVLVVLDNLETAGEPQNEIASQLLPLLNPSKALLTSRHRFEGDLYRINLTGLDESGALRFIRQDAEEKNITHIIMVEDEELKPIAESTGGSPLALQLVVGQLGFLDLEIVLERLCKVHMPQGEDEDDYIYFYKYIFWYSWQLLSDDGRELLVSMAELIPGLGGTFQAIKAGSGFTEEMLRLKIPELWRLSFLEQRKSHSLRKGLRYYLHELTQYFVQSDILQLF